MPDSGFVGNVFPEVFRIEEFVVHECAACGFNPFQSVSHRWCVDLRCIECARDLWDSSPQQLRKLLFETFWNGLHARRPSGSSGSASEEQVHKQATADVIQCNIERGAPCRKNRKRRLRARIASC